MKEEILKILEKNNLMALVRENKKRITIFIGYETNKENYFIYKNNTNEFLEALKDFKPLEEVKTEFSFKKHTIIVNK